MIRRLKNSTYLEEDWRDEIESKDMSKLGILNINIDGNTMKAGSFFDISGIMFKSDTDTVTTGTQKFLYASNNGGLTPTIYRSDTVPIWDPVKLGYYSGADRAIYNFVYNIPMKNKGDVSTTAEGDSLAKIGILSIELYQPASVWNSSTTYQVGSYVYYNYKSYVCIQISRSNLPSSQPSYWTEVSEPNQFIRSGSFWDLSGVVYKSIADVHFTGNGNFLYVNDQTLLTGIATRSDVVPVWDGLKKGFYNGTSRAIYDFYYAKKLENEYDLTVSTINPNDFEKQKTIRNDYSRYLEKSSFLPEILEHWIELPTNWTINSATKYYLKTFKDKLLMSMKLNNGSTTKDYLVFIGKNDLSNNQLTTKNFVETTSPLSMGNFSKICHSNKEYGVFSPYNGTSLVTINFDGRNTTQSDGKVPLVISYSNIAEYSGNELIKFSCSERFSIDPNVVGTGDRYFSFPGAGLSSVSSKKIISKRIGQTYSLVSIPGDMTGKYWNCCTPDSVNNKIWIFPGTKTSGILSINGSNVVENSNYGADTNLFPASGFVKSFMLPNNKIFAIGTGCILLLDTILKTSEIIQISNQYEVTDALLGPDGNVYIFSEMIYRFNLENKTIEVLTNHLTNVGLGEFATYFDGSIFTFKYSSTTNHMILTELKFDKPAIPGYLRNTLISSDWSNL